MKKNLVITVCVLLTGGMLTTGGCVSKVEYDKALDWNRKIKAQLQAEQAKNQHRTLTEQQLQEQLVIAQAQAQMAENDVAALNAARNDLQNRFNALSGKFEDLLNKREAPPALKAIVLPTQVDEALQAFAESNPGLVEYDPKRGMVKIKSDLTFELGSTTAKASAVTALTKLVGIINDPAIAKHHVYIAGHTDNVPIVQPATKRRHPDNWYLSVHRAVAIKKVMQRAGLAPARIGVMGFGEYHPVAENKSSGGKNRGNKLNRRVEIWIVSPDRFLTSPSS